MPCLDICMDMFFTFVAVSGPTMQRALVLIPALLFLLAFPVSSGRYNDDFDDGEDIVDFDDNDFAEFEDMNDDPTPETETAPPARASSSQPEDDEDEATVELEDGQDGFEDAETQVCFVIFQFLRGLDKQSNVNVSSGSRYIQQI